MTSTFNLCTLLVSSLFSDSLRFSVYSDTYYVASKLVCSRLKVYKALCKLIMNSCLWSRSCSRFFSFASNSCTMRFISSLSRTISSYISSYWFWLATDNDSYRERSSLRSTRILVSSELFFIYLTTFLFDLYSATRSFSNYSLEKLLSSSFYFLTFLFEYYFYSKCNVVISSSNFLNTAIFTLSGLILNKSFVLALYFFSDWVNMATYYLSPFVYSSFSVEG